MYTAMQLKKKFNVQAFDSQNVHVHVLAIKNNVIAIDLYV